MQTRCILFVALCWFMAETTLFAQPPADLVIVGDRIITVDANHPHPAAVVVNAGRIVALPEAQQVEGWIGEATKVVRLKDQQTLIPGLIESHGHFLGLGQSLMMLDLRQQQSWEEIVADVAEAAKDLPAGQWIVGRGWHQSKWTSTPQPHSEGYPLHTSLSEAVPNHPVVLTHASGHASFANAMAMAIAGVNRDTPNPDGGEIVRDESGEATGLFRERAADVIHAAHSRQMQLQTEEERSADFQRAVELAVAECHRFGITSFHDAGSSIETAQALRTLAESNALNVRLYVMIRDTNLQLRKHLAGVRVVGAADNFFTVRAIKKSIDGALGPHGAWLLSPYEDKPESRGLATLPVEDVRESIKIAIDADCQVCVHAIGDRANREVLDLYQQSLPREQLATARFRIEHAQHLDPADIPRFGQLGVIAAMQGVHCTSDAPFVATRLGYRRSAQGAYVWRSLIDSGARICNGTDAPVESLNPFPSLAASISRKLADDTRFFPQQCMTIDEAIASYTIEGAFAEFAENEKGSITVGKLADMVILDRDPRILNADELAEVNVLTTILDGKIVYQRLRTPGVATNRRMLHPTKPTHKRIQ